MPRIKLEKFIAVLILVTVHSVAAQELANKITATTVITGSVSAERLRFTAPSSVVQMHLQVYDDFGQTPIDVTARGNVLDWTVRDGSGERLISKSYLCVLTVKSLSGKLSQRIGSLLVQDNQVELTTVDAKHFTPAQQQAVGPIEENSSLTVLKAGETEASTVLAHDGTEGELVRSRGALSFRLGDFFSGQETEQMRLTEAGNLGIGTDKPQAKLDVAGTIRTSEGIEFGGTDGTNVARLAVTTKGGLQLTRADGSQVPNATGTGTQNKIAKWTDNAGTLGDSSLTDTGGNVGLGVSNPGDLLDIAGPPNVSGRSGIHVRTTTPSGNATLYFDNDRNNFNAYGGLLTGGSTNASAFFGVTRADKTFLIADGPSSLGLGIGTLVPQPVIFGSSNAERMRISALGNVGIGTTTPAAKLDVNGVINAATQYNIGGNRVVSINASGNTFVGANAGTANTNGGANTFVGTSAGQNNNASFNSFFGSEAGLGNTGGGDNSFFGWRAGSENTGSHNAMFGSGAGRSITGSANAFFGSFAGSGSAIGTASENSFFGNFAGFNISDGTGNSFFGGNTGQLNSTGSNNTLIGSRAEVEGADLTNATAIGWRAKVSANNSLVLGSINGENLATSNTKVGIGTTSPEQALQVNADSEILSTGAGAGFKFRDRGSVSFLDDWVWYSSGNVARFFRAGTGDLLTVTTTGNLGVGAAAPTTKLQVAGGDIAITTQSKGLILRATDGSNCYRVTVNNAGTLVLSNVTCP